MSVATNMNQNYIALANFCIHIKHPCKQEDYVKELLKSGFDVNYTVPRSSSQSKFFGYTALHFTVQDGFEDRCHTIVKLLFNSGADFLRKNDKGFTPLRLAYGLFENQKQNEGRKNLIDTLLTAHCQFQNATNPCCNDGISHFHIACATGKLMPAKFFLKKGVPINLPIKRGMYAGCTALHLAVLKEDFKMVQMLLDQGADYTCLNARSLSPLHLTIEKQLEKDAPSNLLWNNEDILKVLLKANLKELKSIDYIGLSYIHVYCTLKYPSQLIDCNRLLAAGVDINASINLESPILPGYTPLHFAARCNINTFWFLLRNGANYCAKDANGVTPFDLYIEIHGLRNVSLNLDRNYMNYVTSHGYSGFHKYLRNKDPNSSIPLDSPLWPGATLLHLSVKLPQEVPGRSNVKLCLLKGADSTIQDANGMTALHLAFHSRKTECIERILRARLNVLSNPVDCSGLSHFHIACMAGKKKVVRMFLMDGKVDSNVALKTDVKLYYPSFHDQWGRSQYPVITTGSTPLHIAAITLAPWLAKLLLQYGADSDRLDADGMTWMHRIFGYKSSGKFIKLLSLPQNLRSNPVTAGGLSHLHVACCAGSKKAVESLLPLLGDPDDVNRPIGKELIGILGELPDGTRLGDTPLHLASRTRSIGVVDLLLKNGADLRMKNADGLNPLHVALNNGSSFVIERLALEYCAIKMWPDEIGLTPLFVACALKDVPMIEEMLKSGGNVHSRIKEDSPLWPGDTPIHVLIRKGYPIDGDVIKLMLEYILEDVKKAVVDNRSLHESAKRPKLSSSNSLKLPANSKGLSALHISCMLEDSDVVEKFLELGVDFDIPKDYLASKDPGFFPLHFAVKYGSDDVVELLLNYKINVDSQDACGNTPLHLAASLFNETLILFLRTGNFETTKKNVHNQSVMNIILEEMERPDKFDCTLNLLKNGLAKYLDLPAKADVIAKLGTTYTGQNLQLLIRNMQNSSEIDANDHNIFYHINFLLSSISLENVITIAEELANNGCDLDHRDKKGLTALHYAVISEKPLKIKALLFVGADVNVMDINGETPVTTCFSGSSLDYSKLNEMIVIFYRHIHKLKLTESYICRPNKNFYRRRHYLSSQQELLVLSSMGKESINKSFSLRDVLKENVAMRFPIMPKHQRRAILESLDSADLKKRYPDWVPFFNLQRRKALKRENLYEVASESLRGLLDPRLPEHCLDSILVQLSTEDWQNVIDADDK